MQKLFIVFCFVLSSQALASGRSWECWDEAGNLMMSWESGLGSIRPFGGLAAITPMHYAGYDEILSGRVELVESSEPGQPARYVLDGKAGADDYRATIRSTRSGVIADLTNLVSGESESLRCETEL